MAACACNIILYIYVICVIYYMLYIDIIIFDELYTVAGCACKSRLQTPGSLCLQRYIIICIIYYNVIYMSLYLTSFTHIHTQADAEATVYQAWRLAHTGRAQVLTLSGNDILYISQLESQFIAPRVNRMTLGGLVSRLGEDGAPPTKVRLSPKLCTLSAVIKLDISLILVLLATWECEGVHSCACL